MTELQLGEVVIAPFYLVLHCVPNRNRDIFITFFEEMQQLIQDIELSNY